MIDKKNLKSKRKTIFIAIPVVVVSIILIMFGLWSYSFSRIPEMFRLNKECQEEGYYMGEFEFKMLGLLYYLDRREPVKAVTGLTRLYKQLKTREGLIKVPVFRDKKDEFEFYLNLQNPKTGAFMDDSYPYCTYNEVTENVLQHLSALAVETGQPLRLKYPLKYLDEINTPAKLGAFLDDVSRVGWIGNRFPQTTYFFARGILTSSNGEGIIEKCGLYKFSEEWRQELLRWFYESQDSKTGFWGPVDSSGNLLRKDLTNTASIIKAFVDSNGNDICKSFPLKHKKEMFETALKVMSEPAPSDDNLDEWHDWALKMGKGSYFLTRYLWKDASQENRDKAKKIFINYIKIKFEKNYVPEEGAFSYYPGSVHATLDGTGSALGDFKDMGFFSEKKQLQLWGKPELNSIKQDNRNRNQIQKNDINSILISEEINSVRFYAIDQKNNNYNDKVLGVFYPGKTKVPDMIELMPKVKKWINSTSQSMGNWTSREDVLRNIAEIKIKTAQVYKEELPLKELNQTLKKNKKLIIIGFDILQIPRLKKVFYLL